MSIELVLRRTCSQCGKPFSAPSCGPTHALIQYERQAVLDSWDLLTMSEAGDPASRMIARKVLRRYSLTTPYNSGWGGAA